MHRDIKPSNVLITDSFHVVCNHLIHARREVTSMQKLSDFGLATRLPSLKATIVEFCGSPNYVSPYVASDIPERRLTAYSAERLWPIDHTVSRRTFGP